MLTARLSCRLVQKNHTQKLDPQGADMAAVSFCRRDIDSIGHSAPRHSARKAFGKVNGRGPAFRQLAPRIGFLASVSPIRVPLPGPARYA
jgi:hypothetical protein